MYLQSHNQPLFNVSALTLLISWFFAFALTVLYCYLHGYLLQHPVTSVSHSGLWSLSIWLPWAGLLPAVKRLRTYCSFSLCVIILAACALVGKLLLSALLFANSDVVLTLFRYLPFELMVAWLLLLFLSPNPTTDAKIPVNTTDKQQLDEPDDLPVPHQAILWISAARNYVELFTENNNHLMRTTLTELSASLQPYGFIRTHRSHMINKTALSHVKKINARSYKAVLRNGTHVPVSLNHLKTIEQINPARNR